MKTTDIAKIRQLADEIFSVADADNEPEETHGFARVKRLATEILALLPCETCGGTGKKPRPEGQQHCRLLLCKDLKLHCGECDSYIPTEPCPDCQPKSKDNEGVCPDCGEYHPTSTICPPHEVRMK